MTKRERQKKLTLERERRTHLWSELWGMKIDLADAVIAEHDAQLTARVTLEESRTTILQASQRVRSAIDECVALQTAIDKIEARWPELNDY